LRNQSVALSQIHQTLFARTPRDAATKGEKTKKKKKKNRKHFLKFQQKKGEKGRISI
jgi:hypothetical protein